MMGGDQEDAFKFDPKLSRRKPKAASAKSSSEDLQGLLQASPPNFQTSIKRGPKFGDLDLLSSAPTSTTQGVSSMLANNSVEKEKPSAAASSALSSAANDPTVSTATEETLVKAEQELAFYIYLQKGLTTNSQTSQVSQYASYIPGASLLGAKAAVGTRYHMLDDVLIENLKHYQTYVQALQETSSEDSGSQQKFLVKLKTLDDSLTPKLTAKGRFASLIGNLHQQFLLASTSNDKNQLKRFIDSAKLLHATAPLPVSHSQNETIKDYVKKGPRTPLTDAVYAKTLTSKPNYKDLKENECTQLDAQLMMSLVLLHEQSQRTSPPALDVLNVFHQSLNMLKLIRQKAGMPDTLKAEEKIFDEEKNRLKDYRNPEHDHGNAKELMNICKGIPEKCVKLSGSVKAHAANKPEERFFDSDLAARFLKALDAYAQTPTIQSKVEGLQTGITGTQVSNNNSQKKITV